MPYKDKQTQREAKRLWAEKHRKGSTLIEPKEKVEPVSRTLKVEPSDSQPGTSDRWQELKDGQWWYKDNNGYHPQACQCKAHIDRTGWTPQAYNQLIT